MAAANPRLRAFSAALVVLAALLLAWAYSLPTVTYSRLAKVDQTYSIYGGAEALWGSSNYVLAAIVLGFSMLFPIAKLVFLGVLLSGRGERGWVRRLSLLGKWSMVDVFVIAGFVGAMRVGVASGTSRPGIHLFTLGVVVSMFAAMATERWMGKGQRETEAHPSQGLGGWGLACAMLQLSLLMMVLTLPLFVVRVQLLVLESVNTMSPVSLTRGLWDDREYGLAAVLFLWAWAVPLMRAVASVALHAGLRSRAVWKIALRLDEWNMLAVFALGILVVWVKMVDLTTTELEAGFWIVLLAAALGEVDAQRLRTVSRAPNSPPGDR